MRKTRVRTRSSDSVTSVSSFRFRLSIAPPARSSPQEIRVRLADATGLIPQTTKWLEH